MSESLLSSWLFPDFPLPDRVRVVSTTREGGFSEGPFQSFNLGDHVGDDVGAVNANRARLASEIAVRAEQIQWLKQVHGTQVCHVTQVDGIREADAAYTRTPGVVCVVMTADCLPVALFSRDGNEVAVAHAGWRGLADGVLEQTLEMFSDPAQVVAWMGPAIGQSCFEVGQEVMDTFVGQQEAARSAFYPGRVAGKWQADLYSLARLRLEAAGLGQVCGGGWCTFSDPERFFSFRRDGVTGRQATLIWIEE